METRYRNYFQDNILRNFASWARGQALTTLVLNVISALFAYGVSELAASQWSLAYQWQIGVGFVVWFLILFTLITPYRLWKDLTEENLSLKQRLADRGNRAKALKILGTTWENATHFLNDIALRPNLSVDECVKLRGFENSIYRNVEIISPGEVSTFRTIRTYDENDHPFQYRPASRGGDKTLIILSERLRRVQIFIGKHSPPTTGP